MEFDPTFVEKLAEVMDRKNLTEVEVTQGEASVRVARLMPPPRAELPVALPPTQAEPSPPPQEDKDNGIFAPLVGTAYLSPSPGDKPFVSVGQRVKKGDVLMIIEAMKVMNHISAPHDGIVERVVVKSGQPVEYNEHLMTLQKES